MQFLKQSFNFNGMTEKVSRLQTLTPGTHYSLLSLPFSISIWIFK